MKTKSESTDWKEKGQCHGVIVHEDLPTELRAKRLWSQLVHDMGQGVRCDATYQPAERIKELLDFNQAGLTDIVIVSVHDLARFFFGAAGWLNDWLNAKSCLPRALFVLHDGKEDNQAVGFLRAISESAGVTLFSRGREVGNDPPLSNSKHDRRRAEDLALAS
ncbi:MAG: hypothetical protein WCV00_08900 [Verrucomicrobiia bacterium]